MFEEGKIALKTRNIIRLIGCEISKSAHVVGKGEELFYGKIFITGFCGADRAKG